MLFGRVRCYVLHDTLHNVIIRVLTFLSPPYFLVHHVNFQFVTLTQYARYILYAYSGFNFDICVLVMIMVCVLIFRNFVAMFSCVTFRVFTLCFCCLMLHLLHVSSHILSFFHNQCVTISLRYINLRINFRHVRIQAPS